MPKLGRPFVNLENDLSQSSRDKRQYMYDIGSEVTRNAPFGTSYTPSSYTKIIGSRYTHVLGDGHDINQNDSTDSQRSGVVSPVKENLNRRPIIPPIYSERQRDYDLSELNSLLPPGMELPPKIVHLNNNEQLSLFKLIKYELRLLPNFINKIKETYLLLARIDVNLTGLCSFKEFIDACYQNNIHLTWKLFRVIASQFVVPNRDDAQFVHYEKIISFLGAVYRSLDPTERSIDITTSVHNQNMENLIEKPVYYHDDNCIDKGRGEKCLEDLFDADDAKTIKQISDDIGFNPIPLHKILMACQRADGLHRGTLSANQIRDIFRSEGFVIRNETFEKLLNRSKYMGGGQYSWQPLIAFLEKIQPINTGLQIPSSKMPNDFLKPIPAPAPSWPHAEGFDIHHGTPESITSSRIFQKNSPPPIQDFSQQHSPRPSLPNNQNDSRNSIRNEVYVKPTSPQIEPWFNRFLKFVDSIYIKDINSQGILPTRELYNVSVSLNEQLGLNLSTTEIIAALEGAAVDNDRMYSNINLYLKRLSVR